MVEHVDEAERHVQSLAAAVRRRFVLESEQRARIAHPEVFCEGEGEMTARTFGRRQAAFGTGAAIMAAAAGRAAAVDGNLAARLAEMERDGRVYGLHALLASRGGKVLFEHYGRGEDESWGQKLGQVTFGPTVLHDLRSVTKSIVGMLYGIALADGKVPPPEARLYDQFPEYADLAKQPGRERLTVAHVLSMTLGFEWDELTIPYGDRRNSEVAMELSPDRYRYVLDRPIVGEPGVKWTYNGGCTALLGRLITKGTGDKLPDYARRVLFDPMGLGPTEWSNGLQGEAAAASGLRMRPPDLLRIGQMVLAGGAWQGRQIVPAAWLKQSTSRLGDDRRNASVRLALVSERSAAGRSGQASGRHQWHRLGWPAPLHVAGARSRRGDELPATTRGRASSSAVSPTCCCENWCCRR